MTTDGLAWHARPAEEALELLGGGPVGLDEEEVARRRETSGPNALADVRPVPWWRLLARQFRGLVVALLAAAAAVAVLLGDRVEAVAIAVVLLVNAALGFWVEWRARRAMEGLRRLQVQEAVVVRAGVRRTIDARDLVPGDLLEVEAGAAVPADARLVAARELTAIEAPLTGESVPVAKAAAPVAADTPLAERASMLYKGTLVADGEGRAVVTAIGRATEVGRISELVAGTVSGETPLERKLDRLGRRLVWATLGVAAVVALLGVLRGEELLLMVETALALAVAAVPEGLPVVVTITLALGMRRMARRRALVRSLPAVETLGAATVICADKTGTLTAGEMTVTELVVAGTRVTVTGTGYRPDGELRLAGRAVAPGEVQEVPWLATAVTAGALANHGRLETDPEGRWWARGDPTEAALLALAAKAGLDRAALEAAEPEIDELPFSSERRLMATFHRRADGATVVYLKGAPGRLTELSGSRAAADAAGRPTEVPLDEEGREALRATNRELAGRGLRVLALAHRVLEPGEPTGEGALRDLVLLGFAGISDPPAAGVAETVAAFRRAGVATVMITGDQRATAEAVAREVGLIGGADAGGDGAVATGAELAAMDDEELARRVGSIAVYGRTTPADKLRIVEAFHRRGAVVAMLGDGVNDAPALKRADIGVAMGGRGTDVAKETADLVLQDDRFETVAVAVEEGRVIFDNLRKFVFFLFSCNLAEVMVVLVTGLAGLPLPLRPLQLLWLNLLTDVFPALSLAVEPAEPDVMRRPPRDPAAGILSRRFVVRVTSYASLLAAATLAVFVWGLGGPGGTERAVTLAFSTLALGQIAHLVDARAHGPLVGSRRLFANPWAWAAMAFAAGLQVAAVHLPGLSRVLGTVPLSAADWAVVAVAALAPVVVGQGARAVGRGRRSASHR